MYQMYQIYQPTGYMRGRPVEAILEREAAEHLVERGTRGVEGGRLVFSRDRRFTLFIIIIFTFMQTKYMKHIMHISSNVSSARYMRHTG